MIDFDLVMIAMGVLGGLLVAAWIASPRLRAHVEHPKHAMLDATEQPSPARRDDENRPRGSP